MFINRQPIERDQSLFERRLPADALVWAIGDIHGQLELLRTLGAAVSQDLVASTQPQRTLVLLGDYIDRGLGSREVIDHILELGEALRGQAVDVRCLMGNHEELLLKFLDDPAEGPRWAALGGRETLISYGVAPPHPGAALVQWAATASALAEAMPPRHLGFLLNLEMSLGVGDYHFVHAGVRPDVKLSRQCSEDALWIRDDFLLDRSDLPKMVVHGHSAVAQVHMDHRRICIDTGAYATGALTALRLEGSGRSILQVVRERGELRVAAQPL